MDNDYDEDNKEFIHLLAPNLLSIPVFDIG